MMLIMKKWRTDTTNSNENIFKYDSLCLLKLSLFKKESKNDSINI